MAYFLHYRFINTSWYEFHIPQALWWNMAVWNDRQMMGARLKEWNIGVSLWSILCSDFSSPFCRARERGAFFLLSLQRLSGIDRRYRFWADFLPLHLGNQRSLIHIDPTFFIPHSHFTYCDGKIIFLFFFFFCIFYNGVYWGTLININLKFSVVFTYPRDLERRQPPTAKPHPRQTVHYDSPQT